MSGINHKLEERHEELLTLARTMLITNGLGGMNIERLAKDSGYSRPTVYGHFKSKQAVIDALAERNLEVTRQLMDKAAGFDGTAREQAFAWILAYEMMARFHTEEFHMTEFMGMPWVRERLPEPIAVEFAAVVKSYFDGVTAQVERAVEEGDLELVPGLAVGNVVFHSLSMTYGIYTSIVKNRIIMLLSDPVDPWIEARTSLHSYWDGLGWNRSGVEVDCVAVADRILKDSFPDYWLELEMDKLKKDAGLDTSPV